MVPPPLYDHHLPDVSSQPAPSAYRRDSIIANAMYRKNSVGVDERKPTYHKDQKSNYVLPNEYVLMPSIFVAWLIPIIVAYQSNFVSKFKQCTYRQ